MSPDFALALAQVVSTACLTAWMLSGVIDNWMHPHLNAKVVAEVMGLDRLAEDFPDEFAKVAYRRVQNPRATRLLFYSIVAWESLAAILLTIGTVLLLIAFLSGGDTTAARAWAMLGCLAFVANWSAFLVGGNYFCYWYCYFGSQATHFFLVLWGMLGILLLAIPV